MGQTKLMNHTLGRAGGMGTEIPVLERSFFAWLQEPAVEDVVASWSVRSSPDRAVWVRAVAGDIVLCSWARHFTL